MKLIVLTGVCLLLTMVAMAQSPVPLRGGGAGRQGAQGQRGGGPFDSALPATPTAIAIPAITAEMRRKWSYPLNC